MADIFGVPAVRVPTRETDLIELARDVAASRRAKRSEVYAAIDSERDYQDDMQVGPDGRTDGRQKSVGDYLTLVRVYSQKADEAYSGSPGDEAALHVIRKIAGIAVQAMEVHGAPRRPGY